MTTAREIIGKRMRIMSISMHIVGISQHIIHVEQLVMTGLLECVWAVVCWAISSANTLVI
ncbi:MAG: hypothetical protein CBC48_19360 [bacterium TMED88]|nr:MAG: hypothetical protein CBC48_19360 [bacterium TMED88]